MNKTTEKVTKTDVEWRAELSPEAYNVLRQKGTERPFTHDAKNPQTGIYQCAGCGQELFESDAKFDSGTRLALVHSADCSRCRRRGNRRQMIHEAHRDFVFTL